VAPRVEDDRAFLTDGRPYLNVRQAAIYCGFEAGPVGTRRRTDPAIRRFHDWAYRHGLRMQPGRDVFRRVDLDATIARQPAPTPEIDRARALAHQDAAAFRRGPRAVTRPR
jgi:hypothetical protein